MTAGAREGPALTAADLVAGYRSRRRSRPVVAAPRLEVARGEVVAVVGPNGAGKSTLLRTLVGAQPALAGTVEVEGRRLDRLDRRSRARHLAVVLTDRVEPGRLTAGEVIALGRHPHTGWTGHLSAADLAAARAAADLVEMAASWDRPFAELSDGQRQRVLVARALAQDPALIVLDEPTAFLDLPGRAGLTTMLGRLARRSGVATVLSTHDLDLALGHADTLWVVHQGAVTAGAPEDLVAGGALAAAFAHEGMTLDPASGLMRTDPPDHPVVAVAGSGTARALAAHTATRCGLRVADGPPAGGGAWAVLAAEAGWTFDCGARRHAGTTYDALARTLRAHLPAPDTVSPASCRGSRGSDPRSRDENAKEDLDALALDDLA
ncbi:MAG TPA: ABC transporter ATP-binding protein [Acidimicrobiales bacterium]